MNLKLVFIHETDLSCYQGFQVPLQLISWYLKLFTDGDWERNRFGVYRYLHRVMYQHRSQGLFSSRCLERICLYGEKTPFFAGLFLFARISIVLALCLSRVDLQTVCEQKNLVAHLASVKRNIALSVAAKNWPNAQKWNRSFFTSDWLFRGSPNRSLFMSLPRGVIDEPPSP